jgi:anaerobic selenocysteine-containing dehydrogenase
VRETDPKRLAFFTGRDQSQSLTGFWAAQFGTPNFAAHGGFCSVNMAAGGLYSIGGSFWEFGEPDWDRTRLFLMFGVAEDHDSNPVKLGLSKLKERGAKFVSVNPVRTGYSAIADEWVGIRPGTDGLLVLALVHELLRADRVDLDFLARYTNATWLIVRDPGGADDGLAARDEAGKPLAWDRERGAVDAALPDLSPVLAGEFTLPDGRRVRPVFHLMAERYLGAEYAPEAVAERCGVPAERIRRLAAEIAAVAFDSPWWWSSPGPTPTAAGTSAWWAARCRSTPCAASPRTPTASTPAARCTCCRCCWARSIRLGRGVTSRPSRGRSRPRPARPARARSRTRRSRATSSPSRTGRTICWWTRRAGRSASTRRSRGRHRSACTG